LGYDLRSLKYLFNCRLNKNGLYLQTNFVNQFEPCIVSEAQGNYLIKLPTRACGYFLY